MLDVNKTKYLVWKEKTIEDFSDENVREMYEQGYVFTRKGKGVMQQTRSIRVDLDKFELSSENRRVLKQLEGIELNVESLPMEEYQWQIAKLAKDFYTTKFGDGTFSANKVKELLTDESKSNFNALTTYSSNSLSSRATKLDMGYAICYAGEGLLHYSYPFYDLQNGEVPKSIGMGMMLMAIMFAKEQGDNYVYLGSTTRPTDTYKLQFSGLEWFDKDSGWQTNLDKLKDVLKMSNQKHIHFIGICGVATSAEAIAFKNAGWKVTGSDKGFYPPVSNALEMAGISYYAGWHPEKMISDGKPDLVIVGASSGSTNPETQYAIDNDIEVVAEGVARGKYFARKNSIVCTGTWGKTSSSALLAHILTEGGLDPSYMTGGLMADGSPSARLTESNWSVLEGDEYKASPTDNTPKFAYCSPTHLVLTSVSWDHADLYPTEDRYFSAFGRLIESIPKDGLIIANIDNPGVMGLISRAKARVVTYSKSSGADYVFANVGQSLNGLRFGITKGKQAYAIESALLGSFQAENITACFAMAKEIGLDEKKIALSIRSFNGIKRRLEKRLDKGVVVIDDIAHSPEKVQAVLRELRDIFPGKLIAIFEPNSGGRTGESAIKYNSAFSASDCVLIPRLTTLKVDPTGKIKHMDGNELANLIARSHSDTRYIDDDEKLVNKILELTHLPNLAVRPPSGDHDPVVVAFLGSHGFRGMIEATCLRLQSLPPQSD